MTFEDYVSEMPGLSDHARRMYLLIDAKAACVGEKMIASYDLDDLRSRSGSPWLQGFCNDIADAIERDPSGRLAASPSLRAWAAGPDGIGNSWINFYIALLQAHIEHEHERAPRPQLVAAAE